MLRRLVILLKKNYYDVHICEKKIALNQDYISATIIDVMETEPLQTLSLLWEYPWVVASLRVSDTCIWYSGVFFSSRVGGGDEA